MADRGSFEWRAFLALGLAAGAGLLAAFVAAAAVDREPYDDGIELFLPTTAAAAGAGAVVLVGFVATELWRGGRAAAARLSAAARGLAGMCLVGGTLGMATLQVPLWIALPYSALAATVCFLASLLLRLPSRHANPTSLMSHSGVQSPSGGEG